MQKGQLELTKEQKKVLETLLEIRKRTGQSPAEEELAAKLKEPKAKTEKALKVLAEKGYLMKKQKSGWVPADPCSRGGIESLPMAKIGIIGYGIVGQAVAYGFSNQEIHIYDKFKDLETLAEVVKKSEFLFLCLPTPIKEDESGVDLTILNETVAEIAPLVKGTRKIVIIKSTVAPGTTLRLAKEYPGVLFCFNPEFLTERSFWQDFVAADRVVIGAVDKKISRRVAALYGAVMPTTPIFETKPTEAELAKYMANCFLATKVIFGNEMAEICEKLGAEYEEVKKLAVADRRIFDSHLQISPLKGFGGKCFPKDLLALRGAAKKAGAETMLLDTVWEKNLKIRKVKDWEEIPFAVSKKN